MTQPSLFAELEKLAADISAEAVPTTKKAADDPGGYMGGSSHPSANVDNDTQDATEGERSSENESDVKGAEGAKAVDHDSNNTMDQADFSQGVQRSATGEDPAIEDDYKDKKDDPGTGVPAVAGTEKYASMSFGDIHKSFVGLSNDILARLASDEQLAAKRAAAKPATNAKAAAATNGRAAAPADDDSDPFATGYKMAAAVGWDKQAAAEAARNLIEETIIEATQDADDVINYLSKIAMDEADDSEGHTAAGDADSGANDSSGSVAPPSPEAAPPEPAAGDISAVLGGLGAEDPAMAGGDPAMAGGDPAMAAGPEGEMGGIGEEEALMQLAMALEELGIPLEALAGAGGGAPKMASAVREFKRAGKFQFKEATGRDRKIRDLMKSHLQELVGA